MVRGKRIRSVTDDSDGLLCTELIDERPSRKDSAGDASKAFINVKKHFENNKNLSAHDQEILASASSIEDVQKEVSKALAKYQARKDSQKATKWLRKASEMICHYDSILEVFVQHHPEYVALAWGTIKLLFVVSTASCCSYSRGAPAADPKYSLT